MRITPINMAEAVIEPFWDPAISGLKKWQVESGAEHGLNVSQNWCWVHFEWARKPASGPALRMARSCDVNCRDYNDLLVSVMAPEGSVLRVEVETNLGMVKFVSPPASAVKKEHAVDLEGASRIRRISLEMEAAVDGIASGWFNWIGLRNRRQLKRYERQWQRFDARWEGFLKPESFEPSFMPAHGLLVNAGEFESLRVRHTEWMAKEGTSPFVEAGAAAGRMPPETCIGEYVNFWNDSRYNRERDHGKFLLNHGPNAAIAGLLLRDKALLRMGARYAMALAMCANWDDSMICCFPDGTFDHRCFVQSLCAFDAALILDLAGECFTNLGRQMVLRKLATEGLGHIHYNTWKYDYIFRCNQLAWFTPGRMLACLVQERHWKHMAPYTELARTELVESLNQVILPDGGYVEGPTYFRCVGRDGGIPLYLYARARGLKFEETLPESMRRCRDFGEIIQSTDDDQDVVPFCDAGNRHEASSLAVMAKALPGTAWTRMLDKAVRRKAENERLSGGRIANMSDLLLVWSLSGPGREEGPDPAPFVSLPVMGCMALTRRLGTEWIKILLMGNMAGAGHAHEDKGSFVLEFAGDTFAMDPGTCDYSSPFAGQAKNCERHNMLIPCGLSGRPHPACPLPADVKPQGTGDAKRFHATIDLAAGWEGVYRKWVRTWDSSSPEVLSITDEYELLQGDAVEFCWSTIRPVEVRGRIVTLKGRRGRVELQAPADCSVRIDDLPFFGGAVHHRVVFRREGRSGSLTVTVRLQAL